MAKIAVAPLVGAWIEIMMSLSFIRRSAVAPLVGAWIEIQQASMPSTGSLSLPSWERGLKSDIFFNLVNVWNVAPLVGAWIEIFI